MTTTQTAHLLTGLLRREWGSFLQYLANADLYVTPETAPAFDRVRSMAGAERAELDCFAERLQAADVPLPFPGSFPMSFTGSNFLSVMALLPKLIASHGDAIRQLEADRAALEEPWAGELAELVRLKHNHLAEIEKLAG